MEYAEKMKKAREIADRLTELNSAKQEFDRLVVQLNNMGLTYTTNIMSNKVIPIRQEDKGTCVDPGTERYWSM